MPRPGARGRSRHPDARRRVEAPGRRGRGRGEPRLGPGSRADIVLLDLAEPAWIPLNDPLRQLVFSETGAGVDSVLIDGRLVVHRRRVLTVDTAALRRDVEAAVERLR